MLDITNQVFGRLTATSFSHKERLSNRWKYYWNYVCTCNKLVVKNKHMVTSGKTRSCGSCIKSEINTRHGMSGTRFHDVWENMRSRCSNVNSENYKNYGGRGIRVCDRWNVFENFRDDMYKSYMEHLAQYGRINTTIDRIDNHGNYEPSNCRWATKRIQSRNKRNGNAIIPDAVCRKCGGEVKIYFTWRTALERMVRQRTCLVCHRRSNYKRV